ncbi:helix-turn-helix domain-containing protein [Microvirga sp. 2TAF3]|uniref:helix-turn-helix domain-containing protein n=1 Tax=Microvirga sp. 2TAF3 TaxID=3233014 RepID=UPI003F99D7FA
MATKSQISPSVQRALRKLGADIAIARRKRRLRISDLAEAAGISLSTLRRLQQGDPAVSLGALAMVLMVLGERHRINDLIDVSKDDAGLLLDIARLPKRIRQSSNEPQGF